MNRFVAYFEIDQTAAPGFARARALAPVDPLLARCARFIVCVGLWIWMLSFPFLVHSQQAQGNGEHSAPHTSGTARQIAALKRACSIGALDKDECDQKMAALMRPASLAPANASNASNGANQAVTSNDPNLTPDHSPHANANMYHDNQGRYSLLVPDGWTARPESDGSGTLQLKRGSAWATVALMTGTGEGSSRPMDIAHGILQELKPDYREPQLLDEGDFENNGHAAYGANATGIDRKGARVTVTVVSIQARGLDFLSLVSSAPSDQAHEINDQVMQMVKSIRFHGE
jgi:hypothetical protein